MRKIFLILGVVLLVAGSTPTKAKADGMDVNFNVTGTYANGTISDGLCAPGQTFAIDFTLPVQPPDSMGGNYVMGDDFYLYPVQATFSMGGGAPQTGTALLGFYETSSAWQSGGFFVNYCPDDASCNTGTNYQWAFSGAQEYTGPESNPTFTPSSFAFTNQSFTVFQDTFTVYDSTICGNVNTSVVSTPEPSVMVLLLAGLGLLGLAMKKTGFGSRRYAVR